MPDRPRASNGLGRVCPRAAFGILALAGAIGVAAARLGAHDPVTTKVTWSREIVRIVDRRCAGCHVAGGVAPMPFQTYDEVRPWARGIEEEVVARRMPMWPAARGFGAFANDRSLSPFEIELIAAWVDGGAPKGNDRDLPKGRSDASSFRDAKKQDLAPLPIRTTAPGGERRTVSVRTTSARDRWITGWRFHPNDPAIVQAEFRLADGTYLGHWVPPEDAVALPPGAGVRLPAGAAIDVTLWQRSAREQQDFPVGLPARAPVLALTTAAAAPPREAHALDAPCGETPVPPGAEIFAVRPWSAAPDASLGIALRRPEAPPRVLAWVRAFDPSYPATLVLRDPVAPPADARLDVESGDPSCRALVLYTTPAR